MYATTFKNLSLEKRAALLCKFLKIKPEDKESFKGYKQVLSFMVGGMCILNRPRYASEDAIAGFEKKMINEHTIPISIIVDYLLSKDTESISDRYLVDFLKKVTGIALLSEKEDARLNSLVKTSLPPGTCLEDILDGKVSHSCRYDYAEIRYIEIK